MYVTRKLLTAVEPDTFDAAFSKDATQTRTPTATVFRESLSYFKKFAVGNFMWFVADATQGIIREAGGKTEEIVALRKEDLENKPPMPLFERTHPDDLPQMFAFTNAWVAFLNQLPKDKLHFYHPTIYLRMKNKAGHYKWVMVQFADHLFDKNGRVLLGLTCVTDISHIKTEGPPMMTILDVDKEECRYFYCQTGQGVLESDKNVPRLSNREIEVLNFLSIGFSSKQIAVELYISVKTVDNHRQNMLHKTQTKSSSELINFAIRSGYL
jgi:DNA-binding CsgD family transcriptional regulator